MLVNGSLDSLQMNIDFYLGIISKDFNSDTKVMRDRFFKIFKDEDNYREENFLVFQEKITDNYRVDFSSEPELFGDEEVYDFGACSFESDTNFDSNYLDTELDNLENEKKNLEEENDSSSFSSSFLETENNYLDNEEDEFVSSDYDDFVDYGSLDNEEEVLETETYSLDEEESLDENVDLEDDEFIEVNWVEDTSLDDDEFIESNWAEDDSSDEDIEDNESEQDWGTSSFYEDVSVNDNENEEDIYIEDADTNSENLEIFSDSDDFLDEESEEYTDDVPSDLREFIKKYPNCEMSFALQYFSKREIDKQLSLGRVFKRKNRLLI